MLNPIQWIQSRINDPVNAYQVYQAARYLISLIISVIMVKSGMSTSELGNFEVIIFITYSFSYFWSVGIKNALMSFYPSVEKEIQGSVLHSVFLILLFAGFCFGMAITILPGFVSSFFASQGIISYLPLAGLYLFLSSPLLMIESVLLLRKNSHSLKLYSTWSLGGILMVSFFIGIFYPTLKGFLYALVFFSFIKLLYLCYIIDFFRHLRMNYDVIRTFFLFSLPMIMNVLIGSAMDFIDGWFVTRYFDSSTFAIFRYGARELPLSMVLYGSLSTAMIPALMAGDMRRGELKRRATNLMHYLFPMSIILIFVSPMLFTTLYSPVFRESAYIFNIYLLVLTSRVLLPQTYNFALHQHKIILWSGVIEVVSNILLSYWWMQIWGIYGLAFATVVAYFIQKILLIIYNKLKNGLHYSDYIDLRYYFVYCFISIFAIYSTFKYK